jgi:intracellular septation protein
MASQEIGGVAAVGRRRAPRWLGPTVDYGPLLVFFAAYSLADILTATAAMLVATVLVLGLSLILTRRIPTAALVTSAMLLIFGGLTLWLEDPGYLKLQSTLISALFAVVLAIAVAVRWPLLRSMFGAAWPMSEGAWRVLTFRLAGFFAAMAGINEAVARSFSTDIWVDYNVFGQAILTLLFLLAQWPLLSRNLAPQQPAKIEAADRG